MKVRGTATKDSPLYLSSYYAYKEGFLLKSIYLTRTTNQLLSTPASRFQKISYIVQPPKLRFIRRISTPCRPLYRPPYCLFHRVFHCFPLVHPRSFSSALPANLRLTLFYVLSVLKRGLQTNVVWSGWLQPERGNG